MKPAAMRKWLGVASSGRTHKRLEDAVGALGLDRRYNSRPGYGDFLRGLGPDSQTVARVLIAVTLVAAARSVGVA